MNKKQLFVGGRQLLLPSQQHHLQARKAQDYIRGSKSGIVVNNHQLRSFHNYYSSKYTQPLKVNQYEVSPSRAVPEHIIRPPYVGQEPQVHADLTNDPIHVMNDQQIAGLRRAANLGARTLKTALDATEIGMTLDDVDKIVHDYIVANDAYPSAIGFHHFPKSVCTSVNDVVSHGVPNNYVLQNGDYLNIDVVCYQDGHHGDNSGMVLLGDVHPDIVKLSKITRESMYAAIEICRPGRRYDEIGAIIEDYAHGHGFAVNREFGGHGIAHELHLPPLVHHYREKESSKVEMRPGMAFTIEPILMLSGRYGYIQWNDNWTVQAPGVPSAQWEHIILITETDPGYEILTLREGETSPFENS